MVTQIFSPSSCHFPALLIRRRFVKETLCYRRRSVTETFCYGDVLYGDVLSRRRFVWRRFVCAPWVEYHVAESRCYSLMFLRIQPHGFNTIGRVGGWQLGGGWGRCMGKVNSPLCAHATYTLLLQCLFCNGDALPSVGTVKHFFLIIHNTRNFNNNKKFKF
jgi:hypothetical protein